SLLSIGLIAFVIGILPSLQAHFNSTAGRIAGALSVFFLAQLIVRSGRLLDVIYSRLPSVDRPGALRGYVTVGSFLVYITAVILIISILMNKSPIYFLTGLGAISAILLIVFRDTLLSMFANVIVTTGDLVRVDDWISVPKSNADGYVIDVSLNVVKVQNFDKTISVLPTYTLVQESFVNYRGMYNAGGRRIKRSILLDQRTIRPLSSEELEGLADIPLMDKALELEKAAIADCTEVDRITNSGLFRQYVIAYLQAHPKILKDNFTMLVRHLQPTPNGIPLEVYCFVDDTRWAQYEGVQATIFDQLLSMLPVFGLRVCQEESDFAEPNPESRLVPTAPGEYRAGNGGASTS
ncbi:MAG: mechanosensitive ion channel family protein, partial [Phycisphaerales bacterium]|nr:mechanosensitive ion channel family protein [Phycisphaerales bacterium]